MNLFHFKDEDLNEFPGTLSPSIQPFNNTGSSHSVASPRAVPVCWFSWVSARPVGWTLLLYSHWPMPGTHSRCSVNVCCLFTVEIYFKMHLYKCRGDKREGGLPCVWGNKTEVSFEQTQKKEYWVQVSWQRTQHIQRHKFLCLPLQIILPPMVQLKDVIIAMSLIRFHGVPDVIRPQYGLES